VTRSCRPVTGERPERTTERIGAPFIVSLRSEPGAYPQVGVGLQEYADEIVGRLGEARMLHVGTGSGEEGVAFPLRSTNQSLGAATRTGRNG